MYQSAAVSGGEGELFVVLYAVCAVVLLLCEACDLWPVKLNRALVKFFDDLIGGLFK